MRASNLCVLVHLASGIGNIVFATPLLIALSEMNHAIDLLISGDYRETADLFRDWSIIRSIQVERHSISPAAYDRVIPAAPPFYWARFERWYQGLGNVLPRPPATLFYEDEQEYYLSFARRLGYPTDRRPFYRLPIPPSDALGVTDQTLVIAPGCKTGEMAAKRWPHFAEVAEAFEDVVIIGTSDDLSRYDGKRYDFPRHARMLAGGLTLRETAELLAASGAVVGNDSGLSHLSAATGASTLMIFGPTPDATLGRFPSNVKVMRAGFDCEPCWFGRRFNACSGRIDCLTKLGAESIVEVLRQWLPY